jgi:hypothetical protein
VRKVAVEVPSLTLASAPCHWCQRPRRCCPHSVVASLAEGKRHEMNTKSLPGPKRRHRRLGTPSTPRRRRHRPHPVARRLLLAPAIHPASSCSQQRRRVPRRPGHLWLWSLYLPPSSSLWSAACARRRQRSGCLLWCRHRFVFVGVLLPVVVLAGAWN